MDEDSPIRVLHIHNPHLMWVEVKNIDTYTYRQVGLFGIVPLQASLVDGERVCTKSDRWDTRVNDVVEEFLESKHQLFFKSTYRPDDDTNHTSIFREHPHIFGEIYSVRKQDGVKKQMANCLDNSVYACKSNKFWEMLNDGRICTKLDEAEELDVFQKIVGHLQANGSWNRKKKIFLKCLSSSQADQLQKHMPRKLTMENLEKHEIFTSKENSGNSTPKKLPPNEEKPKKSKNYEDFNFSTEFPHVEFVENVIKPFSDFKISSGDKGKEPMKVELPSTSGLVLSKITVYDEEINAQDPVDGSTGDSRGYAGSQKAIGRANRRTHMSEPPKLIESKFADLLKLKDKLQKHKTHNVHKEPQNDVRTEPHNVRNEPQDPKCTRDKMKRLDREERSKYFDDLEAYAKKRSDDFNIPPHRERPKERLVAYGPPTRNPLSLVQKRVVSETDYTPTKQDKDEESTWNGGKIDWDEEDNSNSDKSKNLLGNSHKMDVYKNCGRIEDKYKSDLNHSVHKNYRVQNGFNESKNYKGSVQNNDYKKLRDDNAKENTHKKNNTSQSLKNNVGDSKYSAQESSRSKLLELMRSRKSLKFDDSMSSGDNSVRTETQLNDSQSTLDDSVEQNLKNVISKTPNSKSSTYDSDDDLEQIHAKLNNDYRPINAKETKSVIATIKEKINVNPYKNLDGSKSIFVENLIQPLLVAHSQDNCKILPRSSLRDIPFKIEIHNTLRNMQVKSPSRLQSVTWPYILRGHSVFMISVAESGKTLGYLPAVCNLVLDYNFDFAGLGPICIIVCATALSVADVAKMCGMFVNHQKVIAGYPGVDNTKLVTDLRNGCDILVSTPSLLYRLLGAEIGVDLRRLTTVVFEDCERLNTVYELEVGALQLYAHKMLKLRTDKQVRVQYILASRKWCNFMHRVAKRAPNLIVTFAAFQECVIYSKTHTVVSFVKRSKKVDAVIEFLQQIDDSKLTVIVCRSDDEVNMLESYVTRLRIAVVACNNQMTLHELYKIRSEKHSSILICCDGNLNHLNITYAHNLVHFSMPAIYSQFCARFAVLNDNYPSMFETSKNNVNVIILLEKTNVEQLPKILNFVKRCSYKVPEDLNEIALKVLEQKDISKAEKLVPICDNLLSLGECANDTCKERHAILQGYDDPKPWMPLNGVITFNIIQYNSAISYSARLLTHVTGGDKTKYPERYGTLCMKLGMFFSKEDNKRLHGEPKLGDICAVAVRKNFIARCKVLKINNYEKGQAKFVVINLIDEEQIRVVRAVELYFLPEEFKTVETYVVKVRLASVRPQDKDVTFSELAMNQLRKITDDDEQLYMKGRVVMTIGNTIFVQTLEACAELSALCETVVKYDFKNLLLNTHAIPNSSHIPKLLELCNIGGIKVQHEPEVVAIQPRVVNKEMKYRWAHLDKTDWSDVLFSNTINAGKFFVRLQKFSKCINSLISDIEKYVAENPEPIKDVCVKDIVLAEFPDDSVYERAMVEKIIDKNKVMCFFVDNADWREVAVSKLKPAPPKLFKRIPFQSIECRLVGVQPPGDDWTDFSTNWLHDNCLEDDKGNSKRIYAKYFTKEKADVTGGHKYGVILVDTTTEEDIVINKRMVELNLAAVKEEEIVFLEKPLDFVCEKSDTSLEDDLDEMDIDKEEKNIKKRGGKGLTHIPIKLVPNENWDNDEIAEVTDSKIMPYTSKTDVSRPSLKNIFAEKPIRSFPLVSDSDEDLDKWDVCIDEDLGKCFGLPKLSQSYNNYNKRNNKNQDDSQEDVTAKRENPKETDVKKLPAIADLKNVNISKTNQNLSDQNEKCNINGVINDGATDNHGSDGDKGYLDEKTAREPKYTNNIARETVKEPKKEETSPKNKKLNGTNGIEPTNNNLKGTIKDVSLYDSDDSISATDNKIEISIRKSTDKLLSKKEEDLDSDDTRSEKTTEINIELNDKNVNKGLHKSILDSDDSEPEEFVKETKSILNKNSTNELKKNTKRLKRKVIPISEIPKTDIAANLKIDELSKKVVKNDDRIEEINRMDEKEERGEIQGELKGKTITITQTVEPLRTPQIVWKQDKNIITVKIKVIVDDYILETGNRSLKFSAYQNEVKYAFDIELYGVIESEKTKHSNKGQYILVTLVTMLKRKTKWLKLTKDIKSWIVYDVDSIDTSSDEENPANDDALKIIMGHHEKAMEIDNDDDDMDDTSGYHYRED